MSVESRIMHRSLLLCALALMPLAGCKVRRAPDASATKDVDDGLYSNDKITSLDAQAIFDLKTNKFVVIGDLHMIHEDAAAGIKGNPSTVDNGQKMLAGAAKAAGSNGTVIVNGDLLDRANFFENGDKTKNTISEGARIEKIVLYTEMARATVEATGAKFVYNLGNHELPELADRSCDPRIGALAKAALEARGIEVISSNPNQPVPIRTPNGDILAISHVQTRSSPEIESQFKNANFIDGKTGKRGTWKALRSNVSYPSVDSPIPHIFSDGHFPAQTDRDIATGAANQVTVPEGMGDHFIVINAAEPGKRTVTQIQNLNGVFEPRNSKLPILNPTFWLEPKVAEQLNQRIAAEAAAGDSTNDFSDVSTKDLEKAGVSADKLDALSDAAAAQVKDIEGQLKGLKNQMEVAAERGLDFSEINKEISDLNEREKEILERDVQRDREIK